MENIYVQPIFTKSKDKASLSTYQQKNHLLTSAIVPVNNSCFTC